MIFLYPCRSRASGSAYTSQGSYSQAGYDPAFGARPLKRVLQQRFADPLTVQILDGRIENGEDVQVDAVGGELVA